ncbi:TetR family transcriptional regulator [Thermoleophilia bacterium SCSIO 60948]|nr:TetR family transcriptional regulator [Thermoleophilia bacterium SCSIO 60948]
MEAGPRTAERREALLEQAIELLADGGVAAITHRSVETAARVPHGSVTYWFGSREGLIDAVVDRLCAASEAQTGAIAAGLEQTFASGERPDAAAVAAAFAAYIDGSRNHQLARLELEIAGGRDPRIGSRMTAAAEVFWRMCEPIAVALGSDDPPADARALASMLDGMLMDRIVHPGQPDTAMVAALERLIGR